MPSSEMSSSEMSSSRTSPTEAQLTKAAIILSIVLILALAGLAIYSVVSQTEGERELALPDIEAPDERHLDPAIQLVIDDHHRPLVVGCVATAQPDFDYAVSIVNDAGTTVDYLVTVALSAAGQPPISRTADVRALGPGEKRLVGVPANHPATGGLSDCTIAAVQSYGRVIYANS